MRGKKRLRPRIITTVRTYIKPRTILVLGGFLTFAILINQYANNNLTLGGFRAYANSSHVISLYVDGQKHIVSSNANTVGDVLSDFKVQMNHGDVVEPAQTSFIDQPTYNVNVYRAIPVEVIDEHKAILVQTGYQSAKQIATAAGLTVYPEDKLDLSQITDFANEPTIGRKLEITRAKPVAIVLAGKTYNFRTQSNTVADLLTERGIQVNPKDIVSLNTNEKIVSGMQLVINKISQDTVIANEPIAPETVVTYDDNMTIGTEAVKDNGAAGIAQLTYLVSYKDKQETSRNLLDRKVLKAPVDREVVRGRKVIAGSRGDVVALAQRMAAARGWDGAQWESLYALWSHESNFNPNARNSGSGACGIPQAYPCYKMPGFPGDAYAQIDWGLNYVANRYGNPSVAWSYWLSHGNY